MKYIAGILIILLSNVCVSQNLKYALDEKGFDILRSGLTYELFENHYPNMRDTLIYLTDESEEPDTLTIFKPEKETLGLILWQIDNQKKIIDQFIVTNKILCTKDTIGIGTSLKKIREIYGSNFMVAYDSPYEDPGIYLSNEKTQNIFFLIKADLSQIKNISNLSEEPDLLPGTATITEIHYLFNIE